MNFSEIKGDFTRRLVVEVLVKCTVFIINKGYLCCLLIEACIARNLITGTEVFFCGNRVPVAYRSVMVIKDHKRLIWILWRSRVIDFVPFGLFADVVSV